MNNIRTHVLVCTGEGCIASGALKFCEALREQIERQNLSGEIKVIESGCLGPCAVGPVAAVYPDGVFYQGVQAKDAAEIVEEHLLKGRIVQRLVHETPSGEARPTLNEIDFFRKQVKIVLRNCGVIDPMRIREYIARDGYAALGKAATEMKPEDVIETMKKAGMRGRGGAGFPTWKKWDMTRRAAGDVKYVICNGDEGDPGAFMDRSLLEGDPHSVIEGMAIAAYAVGANQGYAYIRAEYPQAMRRFKHALEQARAHGLLGKNIFNSGFDFDIEVRAGCGAFVCGEETALIQSIEGNRGEPRQRPPFPAECGLWGRPTCVNNAETMANIAPIVLKGPEWFSSYGTEKSKGTKVFALAGAVNHTGLVEVPLGMPLGEIIYDIGGGVAGGKKFKAAHMGGPSGGCIPPANLDTPLDFDEFEKFGAMMGSVGPVVMDENTCMVDVARFFLRFAQEETCGKCTPCRVGTRRMLEILDRICEGHGQEGDVEALVELGQTIRDTSLCGLGRWAPNPVLSTIRYFRDEYDAHIRRKRCPAGVCSSLVRAPCQSACPVGVDVPGFVSLVAEKRYAEALAWHRERNPFASICARVCFHPCESKCRRGMMDEAVSIRGVKRFMTEQESTVQLPEIRESEENAKRRIAIVGGGPAGLSCAYFLARLGYKPKVFEAEMQPGGMLMQAIPSYRLPREELAREVRMIERLGVEIQTNKRLGKDFTLDGLRSDGYEAVFLAVGAPKGTGLRIPGGDFEGVVDALRFLREFNLTGEAAVGRQVVVIGGGNAAIDAARTAVRLGAESVTVLYRRTRAEMPAFAEEIDEAEHEGVRIATLVGPMEIVGSNDHVGGIRCSHMVLGDFDSSGRRRPVVKENSDFVILADQVIVAIGQKLDPTEILDDTPVRLNAIGYLDADPMTGQTSVPWVFAGGDAVVGPMSVVEAIAQGERAAVGIDMLLSGESHAFWRRNRCVDTEFDPDAEPAPYERAEAKMIPVQQRALNFQEVELSMPEPVALREARRCLRCDYRPPEEQS